ncbi:MAG: hypothetical protein V4677_05295 [Bacteroidota bacterium]
MKSILKLSLILCLAFSFSACKKNQLGGKATVKGVVAHHGVPIPNAVVYIKFKTSEFPGDDGTTYDTSVSADAEGNYSIDFYKGTYYLYAVGLDMNIPYPYKVSGGLSVSVRNKEQLVKDIAVTEE